MATVGQTLSVRGFFAGTPSPSISVTWYVDDVEVSSGISTTYLTVAPGDHRALVTISNVINGNSYTDSLSTAVISVVEA